LPKSFAARVPPVESPLTSSFALRNRRAVSESAPACYNAAMQETWGERITRIIIDLEMKRAGVIYIDTLEDRLADYLDGPERERFLADASKISREPETELAAALYMLLPIDCYIELCVEGFRVKPYRTHAASVAARH
jgi:hypothetical protein